MCVRVCLCVCVRVCVYQSIMPCQGWSHWIKQALPSGSSKFLISQRPHPASLLLELVFVIKTLSFQTIFPGQGCITKTFFTFTLLKAFVHFYHTTLTIFIHIFKNTVVQYDPGSTDAQFAWMSLILIKEHKIHNNVSFVMGHL